MKKKQSKRFETAEEKIENVWRWGGRRRLSVTLCEMSFCELLTMFDLRLWVSTGLHRLLITQAESLYSKIRTEVFTSSDLRSFNNQHPRRNLYPTGSSGKWRYLQTRLSRADRAKVNLEHQKCSDSYRIGRRKVLNFSSLKYWTCRECSRCLSFHSSEQPPKKLPSTLKLSFLRSLL